MKICPKCHKMYEDSQNFCALDGSRLELSPVSQSMRKEQPTSEETPVIPEKEGKVVEAAEPQGEEKQAEAETEDTFQKEEQEGQKDFQQNQYVPPKPSRGFGQMMEDNFPNQENWKGPGAPGRFCVPVAVAAPGHGAGQHHQCDCTCHQQPGRTGDCGHDHHVPEFGHSPAP